jgi:hypothetical protein
VAAVAAVQPDEVAKAPAIVETAELAKTSPIAAAPAASVAASAPAALPIAMPGIACCPLHFVFSENAWVEVVDEWQPLLSRTNPSGARMIGGPKRAPYDITITPPTSVKLYYRGKEIDLSPYAGMGTARLKVE